MRRAFTLAEVLITLAIIGVVAALVMPSAITNSQQAEFRTGLRKAITTLNSAIMLGTTNDVDTPYTNQDLFRYLQKHMSVLKSTTRLPWTSATYYGETKIFDGVTNAAFYTADGMRFEFDDNRTSGQNSEQGNLLKLHYDPSKSACFAVAEFDLVGTGYGDDKMFGCGGCGSLGLEHNPNDTTKVPCAILVDVNGDRRPTPQFVYNSAKDAVDDYVDNNRNSTQKYWLPDPSSKKISDLFVLLITEDRVIPYGVVSQKAMYGAQKGAR